MSLNVVSSFNGVTDPDAGAYIAAVEAADGNQPLEFAVGKAINDFVVGCKADGIWDAIKASCILAGARTLSGALVPLKGAAPTNVGPFVAGDYNRKTGLVGNGSTKYLNSNRNNNADPQNSKHVVVYRTVTGNKPASLFGAGVTEGGNSAHFTDAGGTEYFAAVNNGYTGIGASQDALGLMGFSRSIAATATMRVKQANTTYGNASQTPFDGNILFFGRGTTSSLNSPSSSRLAFYSIGESLDLARLDSRVTALINAFGAAIP